MSVGTSRGIAECNSKLYVVFSEQIRMFMSVPPFSYIEDITTPELGIPCDIAVCVTTNHLYIVDELGAIWRMNLLSEKIVDKFIAVPWQPYRLSINSGRLLITPRDGAVLFLYSQDGQQLNQIPLPRYITASHALESNHNTL